jgi:hypothetical protein
MRAFFKKPSGQQFLVSPQASMQQGHSETGFRTLSPEKPVNNAGAVTFFSGNRCPSGPSRIGR